MLRLCLLLSTAVFAAAPTCLAQTVTSPDGRWEADFADPPSMGQIWELRENGVAHLWEVAWFDATPETSMLSGWVWDNYVTVLETVDPHSANFVLERLTGGLTIDVDLNMLDGANGGVRFDLTWTNTGPGAAIVKPFIYCDLDVGTDAEDDRADWLAPEQANAQADDNGAGATMWAGALGPYNGWQLEEYSVLIDLFEAGLEALSNTGGGYGPADWTGAVEGAEATLNVGESTTLSFGIGGVGFTGGGCAGDLDGDGDTDLADLGILLADFGCTAPGPCPGDLDNDGDTDLADLGILLADFGCEP